MNGKIFSETFSKKGKILSILLGVGVIMSMCILYYSLYIDTFVNKKGEMINQLIFMGIVVEVIVLGIVLVAINFDFSNKIVSGTSLVLLGILGTLLYYEETIRIGVLILFASIIIFMIFVVTMKLNTTVLTMILFSLVPMVIITALIKLWPMYAISTIYCGFTAYIIAYTHLGVKINSFLIARFFGFKNRADEYTKEVLRTHLNMIYLVVFVIINITGGIYGNNNIIYNIVNNCFLTVLAINNIGFKKIKIAL